MKLADCVNAPENDCGVSILDEGSPPTRHRRAYGLARPWVIRERESQGGNDGLSSVQFCLGTLQEDFHYDRRESE